MQLQNVSGFGVPYGIAFLQLLPLFPIPCDSNPMSSYSECHVILPSSYLSSSTPDTVSWVPDFPLGTRQSLGYQA